MQKCRRKKLEHGDQSISLVRRNVYLGREELLKTHVVTNDTFVMIVVPSEELILCLFLLY